MSIQETRQSIPMPDPLRLILGDQTVDTNGIPIITRHLSAPQRAAIAEKTGYPLRLTPNPLPDSRKRISQLTDADIMDRLRHNLHDAVSVIMWTKKERFPDEEKLTNEQLKLTCGLVGSMPEYLMYRRTNPLPAVPTAFADASRVTLGLSLALRSMYNANPKEHFLTGGELYRAADAKTRTSSLLVGEKLSCPAPKDMRHGYYYQQ